MVMMVVMMIVVMVAIVVMIVIAIVNDLPMIPGVRAEAARR